LLEGSKRRRGCAVQALLSVKPILVLEAIALKLTARSPEAAMDLCAASAWRFQGNSMRKDEMEASLSWLSCPKRLHQLEPCFASWIEKLSTSEDWQIMERCRH
jgi:hypothetical protein